MNKSFKPVLLALVIAATISPVQAEDGKLKLAAKKCGFYAKKAVMFPVYMGAGFVTGGIVWYHFAGNEEKLQALIHNLKLLRMLK